MDVAAESIEQAPLRDEDALHLSEIRATVKAKVASIAELRDANAGYAAAPPGSRARLEFAKVRGEVQRALVEEHGEVMHQYYARDASAYVVQFKGGLIRVLLRGMVEGGDATLPLFSRIEVLHLEIRQRLKPYAEPVEAVYLEGLHALLQRLYAVANNLVGLLNALAQAQTVRAAGQPAATARAPDVAAFVAERAREIEAIDITLQTLEARRAKRVYLQSALFATAVAGLLGFLYVEALPVTVVVVPRQIVFAMAMGTLGATLSVVMRLMGDSRLAMPDMDPKMVKALGLLRPGVGAAFGLAVSVLVLAGLVPLAVPSGNAAYFFGALGFLAGYGERWAQDMVFTTQDRVAKPPTA